MHLLTIDPSEIRDEGITRHFVVTGAALGIADPEFEIARPIDLTCQFFKVNRDVVVQGTIDIALRLTCSRCVEAFLLPLRVPVDVVYLPADETAPARQKALEEEATEMFWYAERVIDLAEMVRDKLFLSVPLQPRCTLECKGLCPKCGVNWNVATCQCAQEELGSPFQLLKGLQLGL